MMKYPLLFLFSLSQAAYISRMTSVNRVRAPSAFRPGVTLQRPWTHPRIVQAASYRAPSYVLYRNPSHRYAVKHYTPNTRNVFAGGPWKTTARLPGLSPVTPEYEFMRAASAPPQLVHKDGGAIHTIPAPNLSLSEKPIVVFEATENINSHNNPVTEFSKPTYEVTEKNPENIFQVAKIEQPVGFSKQSPQSTAELQNLLRQGAAFQQMASEYKLSDIGIPQNQIIPQQQHYTIQGYSELLRPQGFNGIQAPQGFNGQSPQHGFNGQSPQHGFNGQSSQHGFNSQSPQHGFNGQSPQNAFNGIQIPHGFNEIQSQQEFNGLTTQQNFNGIPTHQELLTSGADGIMIPPNALYQSDPMFLQKLQTQLLQRFPSIQFIPYAADIQTQNSQLQNSPQHQAQQLLLLENEELKHEPFLPSESKNVVQRETSESSVVALIPQKSLANNVTEKAEPTTTAQPHNITLELIADESRPVTTTIKYVIESTDKQESTEKQETTPIYYAQIGQSVGNVIANGFYSAINDVRAASGSEQVEKPNETTTAQMNFTTITPDLKPYFAQNDNENKNVTELKPLLGVPFSKSPDSVKIAYTLLRAEEKEPKTNQEGAVFAGQIVEASISEDQDFNKEKAILHKRPPLRLFAVTEKKEVPTATSSVPKLTVVKAKIPPKSKLTFDEETGEPVLRIYASYLNGQTQKDEPRRGNIKQVRQAVTQKTDTWRMVTVPADKTAGFDGNQVSQFGLKLRSRSDDYIPLFEEYEESHL